MSHKRAEEECTALLWATLRSRQVSRVQIGVPGEERDCTLHLPLVRPVPAHAAFPAHDLFFSLSITTLRTTYYDYFSFKFFVHQLQGAFPFFLQRLHLALPRARHDTAVSLIPRLSAPTFITHFLKKSALLSHLCSFPDPAHFPRQKSCGSPQLDTRHRSSNSLLVSPQAIAPACLSRLIERSLVVQKYGFMESRGLRRRWGGQNGLGRPGASSSAFVRDSIRSPASIPVQFTLNCFVGACLPPLCSISCFQADDRRPITHVQRCDIAHHPLRMV